MTEQEKEISAKAMFQVAMEAEQEVTALKKELKQRDETIKQLKEALREVIFFAESGMVTPSSYKRVVQEGIIDNARKLLTL